ncbi:hypothetical protein BJ878DRAFT_548661 [Calycina marina]|uniref:Uncharacterized protein n=1 Tax=Calycina marina TaxID=1763456 RepID=A0A9P7Z4X9_9HELO|nr:hypothetical protein BJ878DRAFT_548661 [Calycina marina]
MGSNPQSSLNEQLLSLRSSYSKVEGDLASESSKSAKIEGDTFNGKDVDGLEAFLFGLNAKFSNNTTEFDTEQSKIVFYANHLKGVAHIAIRHTLRENGTVELTDCHEITANLKVALLHSDAAERATNIVKGMKQGKEIFSIWVGNFLAECYKRNFTEPEKIRELRRATATSLFQAANNTQRTKPLPVNFVENVALISTDDLVLTDNLAQSSSHSQQTGNSSPYTFQTAIQITAPASPIATAPDAMDISQLYLNRLVNGKLHPNEKKRRLKAGLCLYDGRDHATAECPKIAAKEKKQQVSAKPTPLETLCEAEGSEHFLNLCRSQDQAKIVSFSSSSFYSSIQHHTKLSSQALVDSGATSHAYIDSSFARQHSLPFESISHLRLNVVDGRETSAGIVGHMTHLYLSLTTLTPNPTSFDSSPHSANILLFLGSHGSRNMTPISTGLPIVWSLVDQSTAGPTASLSPAVSSWFMEFCPDSANHAIL